MRCGPGPSRRLPGLRRAAAWALRLALAAGPASEARAQSLGDLVLGRADSTALENAGADSLVLPPAPFGLVATETLLGSILGAAAGYGVGLLAEALGCDDCDASEPGGDTPGLVLGVPAGATLGVWLVGRNHPPTGRVLDAALGACVGTAIFAGFSGLLDQQSDLVRWSGVVFSGAFGALGWNRSRPKVARSEAAGPPGAELYPLIPAGGGFAFALRF